MVTPVSIFCHCYFPYLGEDNKHVIYILSVIMSKSWTKRASGRNVEADTRNSGSKRQQNKTARFRLNMTLPLFSAEVEHEV